MKSTMKIILSALGCLLLANAHADSAYQWGPWMAQEDIERAILAGADPTELTDPTAAGETPVLPKLVVPTDVSLPRPDVPKLGPVYANLSWSGTANMLLSMSFTAAGSGDMRTITGISPTYSYAGSNALLQAGDHAWTVSVIGPTVGDYKFTVQNQLDRSRSNITPATLNVTGDDYKTGATYTDSLKVGQKVSHSVTLNASGVPTYSK